MHLCTMDFTHLGKTSNREVLQTRKFLLVTNSARITRHVACMRLHVGVELLQNGRPTVGEAVNAACLKSTIPRLFN